MHDVKNIYFSSKQLGVLNMMMKDILLIQIACCVMHDGEINYVLEDDKGVVSCFFEVQATQVDLKLNTHPIALFLSSCDSVQSLFENSIKLKS